MAQYPNPCTKQIWCRSDRYSAGANSVQYIVVHNTANTASAVNEANNIHNNAGSSSFHYVIDDTDIIQCVHDYDAAWHCGAWSGCTAYVTNFQSIGIEVCSPGTAFTEAEQNNLRALVLHLMEYYGVPASKVVRHYDCHSGRKNCPAAYVNQSAWNALHAYITGSSSTAAPAGDGSTASGSASGAPTSGDLQIIPVHYALRVKNGAWWDEVTNFNNSDANGYAGAPYTEHDFLYAYVDRGTLKYRVHTIEDNWLDWVYKGDRNDTVNGCAGIAGHTIDGAQFYYETPGGETYRQAWYRSQTTARSGWLGVCCDDGNTYDGYDGWAGMYGEPMDRLQLCICTRNPF